MSRPDSSSRRSAPTLSTASHSVLKPGRKPPRRTGDDPIARLGKHPEQTRRLLALAAAGTSWRRILEIGRYQGSWTEQEARRILRANRMTLPDLPPERPGTHPTPLPLPPRHLAIAAAICTGQNSEEISATVGLAENTVRTYTRELLHAAGCRDRVALVIEVLSGRLLPCPEDELD